MLLDPDTSPIGRQPETLHIVPSRVNPWYGTIVPGHRFTRQQLNALIRRGADIATAASILVKRQATDREMWWPIRSLPPVYAFECPIIGKRLDGRLKVIAPSGDPKIVLANGWAHHPYRKARIQ